jgi:hypoxanthine phosphoribosyltransferase
MSAFISLEKVLLRPLEKISGGRMVKNYSMDEVRNLSENLLQKLDGEEFDVMVGIERSGVPLTNYLSERMDVETDFMRICRNSHSRFNKILFLQGMDVDSEPKVIKRPKERYEGKKVLVVDDDCGTGRTLKKASSLLDGDAKTAVLLYFTQARDFVPDFYAARRTGPKVLPWYEMSPEYVPPMECKIC